MTTEWTLIWLASKTPRKPSFGPKGDVSYAMKKDIEPTAAQKDKGEEGRTLQRKEPKYVKSKCNKSIGVCRIHAL
jgi:hypothetical protein